MVMQSVCTRPCSWRALSQPQTTCTLRSSLDPKCNGFDLALAREEGNHISTNSSRVSHVLRDPTEVAQPSFPCLSLSLSLCLHVALCLCHCVPFSVSSVSLSVSV